MTASSAAASQTQPDLGALKLRQHGAWSSGDYAIVGTTLQIVGEQLCEALDLRSGQKVLDVAAGNGNATLADVIYRLDATNLRRIATLMLALAQGGLAIDHWIATCENRQPGR